MCAFKLINVQAIIPILLLRSYPKNKDLSTKMFKQYYSQDNLISERISEVILQCHLDYHVGEDYWNMREMEGGNEKLPSYHQTFDINFTALPSRDFGKQHPKYTVSLNTKFSTLSKNSMEPTNIVIAS